MAKLQLGGGGRSGFRASVRVQLADVRRMSREIGKVNGKTLTLVGLDVRDAAKRGIGQTAPARTKAGMKAVGADRLVEMDGGLYRDITVSGSGKPRPAGKPPKSWGPKRFLYNDILSVADSSRGTVVIGPYWAPWLNQLHQFGGAVRQTAYRIGESAARFAYGRRRATGKPPVDDAGRTIGGVIQWTHRGRPSRAWEKTDKSRTANYPARPFMAGSAQVDKAVAKAQKWFRETFNPARK